MHDLLLFDLDGTISDPVEGIERSFNFALAAYDLPPLPVGKVADFIGPPIDQSFGKIVGIEDRQRIQRLVEKYRVRYAEIGYAENTLYTGVREALMELHASGTQMAICTSKRTDFAEKILEMFDLRRYFLFISGGDVGVEKWQQIAMLLSKGWATSQSLMIGDRAVDLIAAHRNGLSSGAVLWGYGSLEELSGEEPLHTFASPKEWIALSPNGLPF